jgi:valyl-tRNA synthetase
VAPWPHADDELRDPAAERELRTLQALVTEVRRFRAEQGLKPGQRVPARLSLPSGGPDAALAAHEDEIRALARLQPPGEVFSPTAKLPVAGALVELDLSGAIDVEAERKRLQRDLAAAEKEQAQAAAKLGNPDFLGKAPEPVVAKIRARLEAAEADIERINAQLAALLAGSAGHTSGRGMGTGTG